MSIDLIILILILSLLIIGPIIYFFPLPKRSHWKQDAKEQIAKMNAIRRRIDVKINIYKEDLEINALINKYPFLEEDFDEYRKLREKFTGIGTIARREQSVKGPNSTDEETNETSDNENNK